MGTQFPSLNSRGQGMIEYILLVVVVITMAFIIGLRLFKPMNEWMNHYIGDYVQCLLDYGELPTLGGEQAENINDGDCDKEFKPFSVGDGRARKDDAASRANANQNNSGSNRGGGGSANVRARNRSPIGAGFDGNAKSNVIQVKTGNENLSAGNRNSSIAYPSGSRQSRGVSQEVQYKGFSGMIEREKDKIKKREEKVRSVGKTEGSETSSNKRAAIDVTPKQKEQRGPDFGENPWDFGSMLRTLLIIVIVIALLLFLAGQLAQISKSMEKN